MTGARGVPRLQSFVSAKKPVLSINSGVINRRSAATATVASGTLALQSKRIRSNLNESFLFVEKSKIGNLKSKIGLHSHSHAAHAAAHAAAAHAAFVIILNVGDHRFGRQHQTGD